MAPADVDRILKQLVFKTFDFGFLEKENHGCRSKIYYQNGRDGIAVSWAGYVRRAAESLGPSLLLRMHDRNWKRDKKKTNSSYIQLTPALTFF